MINRRSLLISATAAIALARPAMAAALSLSDISAYLNALKTAETDFTQYNSDGSKSTGQLFIQRPGRMRFEYAAPNNALVLAAANTVAIFDDKSNAAPQQFPLKRTPLNLILGRRVNLERNAQVTQPVETPEGLTSVTARDPKTPEAGQIELLFSTGPTALRQWIITDEAGGRTAVVLGDLKTGESYGQSLFSIEVEKKRRGF